jgi:mannose/cellobiose epimerase-like protein (N-acyl-D-glucosamine 2-epimerase family)/anti-anti-sigma regulatory factor
LVNALDFTFSDLICGTVTKFEWEQRDLFLLKTYDGREYEVKISDNCAGEQLRNLGEPYQDCTGGLRDMLAPGRMLYAYGVYYPDHDALRFEAKHILLLGESEDEFRFEEPDWWQHQVAAIADFYFKAQFHGLPVDYRNYRTVINLEGVQEGSADVRQETDTISRLVYGFAAAYLMTGDPRFLEAAEKGTEYLRDHFRCLTPDGKACYWYHAIDIHGEHERKVFASEFGDDYDALPAYEQIYALAGPALTYRITGDPRIEEDIRLTVNMFQQYYLDPKGGGYYSHVDPITLSPHAESLGPNRSRKNWNSVGDHVPAYLINAVLATGDPDWAKMLEYCCDIITERFPDYEHSAFVNEKFHDDWSHDQTWGWQQNRAVVGHNLKIAWNLLRVHSMFPKDSYVEFARKIAGLMPEHGMDAQRGGWYDVVSRVLNPGERFHRFAWHNRKAWWQQEQGILAYLILRGVLGDEEYLTLARLSSAFYNAWFLDHDSGAVYFNVLADGMPYLLGNERLKGSHSMGGYHATELAFLATVYTNLLITNEPLELHFQPQPGARRALCAAPDILPPGSVRIESVEVDGQPHTDFDAAALIVNLPAADRSLQVMVRLAPVVGECEVYFSLQDETLTVTGSLDAKMARPFLNALLAAVRANPHKLYVDVARVPRMSEEAARALLLAQQKMDLDGDIDVINANAEIREVLADDEFDGLLA